MFTNSVKRAREIRKFYVAVVQRQLRNVQKKRAARAKLFYTVKPMVGFFFCRSLLKRDLKVTP